MDKPNIILILADDLGYECLGSYGGESYQTPVLDQLAKTGMRFQHAYALPLCTPTRLQLMTGKYNFRNWRAFGVTDPKEVTFGHHMKNAGYETCISGKWQCYSYNPPNYEPEWRGKGMRPEDSGFDEYCLWHTEHTEDKGSRYADPVIQQNGTYLKNTEGQYGPDIFTEYICDYIERKKDDPFFVYYPMALTHGPFQPTPHSDVWPEKRHDNGVAYFKDMVEYMDVVIGRIVKKLDDLEIRENTLVMFIGDNGSPREVTSLLNGKPFQGGKGYSTDAGTRVPFVANWLGTTPEDVVTDDLVDCSDFLDTMMDLAGASLPEDDVFDGVSFAPQLKGDVGAPREWIFAHHNPLPGWGKDGYYLQRWAQDQHWKLYDTGDLFDLQADAFEENPVVADDEDVRVAREKLQPVLDRLK
ncbi:MAG: sulfatase-like hydrolase/transferase [Candidatus Latescibacteria bacterium]|nr:sulfatase-like hydrolase/transferase [Candidatus Latescibacterota bacterium]